MDDELKALEDNHTWSIVPLLHGKQTIGCRWIYKTKDYTQQMGIDFTDTFSLVDKLTTVRVLLVFAGLTWIYHWGILSRGRIKCASYINHLMA